MTVRDQTVITRGFSEDNKTSSNGDHELALRRAFDALLAATASPATALVGAEEGTAEEETLSNTRWFLIDRNDNFDDIDEQYAEDAELDAIVDPSNPPTKGFNLKYIRWLCLRLVQHLLFRLLTALLILLDLALIVADLAIDCPAKQSSVIISHTDLAISCYFVLEICLRAFALTPRVFLDRRHWFNAVDLVIVAVTFAIGVAYVVVVDAAIKESLIVDADNREDCWPKEEESVAKGFFTVMRVLVVLRFVRFVRLFRLLRLYTEHHMIKRAIRQTVSQNKRRYQTGGVDLDLTYVTRRVIAMSFPSSGLMAWYRNPIREVARFLDRQHGVGKYKVYNLCSERTYDDGHFHDSVAHWPVDDHNVPSVNEMIDFVKEVKSWLAADDSHVIAVHCKGGKGRTGTMICILLVELGIFTNAEHSLEYFGQRRTDRNVAKTFQGVETASQIRYVTYFERLLRDRDASGGDSEDGERELRYPERVRMQLKEINITGISRVGKGDGSDLRLEIHLGRTVNPLFSLSLNKGCISDTTGGANGRRFDGDSDCLTIYIPGCPVVYGDVRIKFYCSSASVPKGYEKCAFYFWFHTSFVDRPSTPSPNDTDSTRSFFLKREEIDNPHKEKTWGVFTEDFAVGVRMEKVD